MKNRVMWPATLSVAVIFVVVICVEYAHKESTAHAAPVQSVQTARKVNPRISPAENDQVRTVHEMGRRPEGGMYISALVKPAPLPDKERGERPRSGVQITPSPGRVWDVAQSHHETPRIELVGQDADSTISPGATVRLQVKVTPYAPVTFTSNDGGAFENKLASITVYADRRGLATARFTATDGTTGPVSILAGCPETSGHVDFVVTIK